MVRAHLFRVNADENILFLVTHHIASDGLSNTIFFQELVALYDALSAGKRAPLPDLPIQYRDFAVWQRQRLQGEVLESALRYWKQQLGGPLPLLELPADRPRPAVRTDRGARQRMMLPASLARSLATLGQTEGVTLFITLLAAFQSLLHRSTGQVDITVGTPVASRNRIETEGLIGLFVNTLPLRTNLAGNPTFRELLRRVRVVTLSAFAHQDLPFEKMVEVIPHERSLRHASLFQVLINFQNSGSRTLDSTGLTWSRMEIDSGTSMFDLVLRIEQRPDGCGVCLTYSLDLFEADTIGRLLGHFRTLLEGVVADPDRRLAVLPFLTEAERRLLLDEWPATRKHQPRDAVAHGLFEVQVERTPGAVAVSFENHRITYRELDRRSNRLAHHLRTLGVGPGMLVALCAERSIELIVAVLGVWKAGGAYVPLDPRYPAHRLETLLNDSKAPVLLTSEALLPRFRVLPATVVCLDSARDTIDRHADTRPKPLAGPDAAAYVMYTSGSTGRPKGVPILHRGVNALVDWALATFTAGQLAGMLFSTSVCFDMSVFELVAPLCCGGRIILLRDALDLPECPDATEVTFVNTVPSVMTELLRRPGVPATVKVIGLAGEPLSARLVEQCYQLPGLEHVFNLYGPTEATVYSTFYCVPRDPVGALPIGRPVAGTRAYILDQHQTPVPVGVPGELHLGGEGLARGYLNRPELTAERFIPNPFGGRPGDRLYKTGDRCLYRASGDIEFLGRLDQQVKVRGFRVELGEVKAALDQHPGVHETAVVLRNEALGDKVLVAYVVPSGPAPAPSELRGYLQERLPAFMVPAAYVFLDRLPLLPAGKLDRGALPAPEDRRLASERAYEAPRTPVEHALAAQWSEVLGVARVGLDDDFFDLGGHSLKAVQLFAQIEKVLGRRIPLSTLFRGATIRQLARTLELSWPPSAIASIVGIRPRGGRRPLFIVSDLSGDVFYCRGILAHLGPDQPVFGVRPPSAGTEHREMPRFEDLAARCVEDLSAFQPEGSFNLAGYCVGGNLAYEMACQLAARGRRVRFLALLDSDLKRKSQKTAGELLRAVTAFLTNLPAWLRADLLQNSPGTIVPRVRSRIRAFRVRHGHRFGIGLAATSPLDREPWLDMNQIPEHSRELIAASLRTIRAYRPGPYPGRVTLFRARTRPLFRPRPPDPDWARLARGGIVVHTIPGDHVSMLREPHAVVLARLLQDALDRAEGVVEASGSENRTGQVSDRAEWFPVKSERVGSTR
jgi:amino acid adenylation domain-containing protein